MNTLQPYHDRTIGRSDISGRHLVIALLQTAVVCAFVLSLRNPSIEVNGRFVVTSILIGTMIFVLITAGLAKQQFRFLSAVLVLGLVAASIFAVSILPHLRS